MHNGKVPDSADGSSQNTAGSSLICCEALGIPAWNYNSCCDTFGGWHSSALPILAKLGRQVASNTGREGQEVVRHLRQRLAVLLVSDNVAMLCARTPSFPPPEVDGDVE